MNDTGCSGFMIARSSIGNPWIFKRLTKGLVDNERFIISKDKIEYAIEKHYRGLCDFGGSKCAKDQMFRIEKSYIKNMVNLI
jgi:tRNA-dihydrouridine synthase